MRKQIRDFEGYEIDELGNVYCTRYKDERILRSWEEINTGYQLVRIRKNKKTVCFRVHRLVAEAFLPNPDNLPYVKHKGDNRKDNSVYNLEWDLVQTTRKRVTIITVMLSTQGVTV